MIVMLGLWLLVRRASLSYARAAAEREQVAAA